MKVKYFIPEKGLENMPKSIPCDALEIIISKLKTNVCKIECNDGGWGTGFFCNIPIGWKNIIKVLMTNNHVLKNNDIIIGKKIKFSINNDKKYYVIEIDKSRKIYTNEEYDITIIELKENDNIDKNSFFDIDNIIFNENSNEIFKNKQIYLLHYPKGKQMEYSVGLIKNINNYTIEHLCDTNYGSSGSPIINSINFQIIGIHKGAGLENNNIGTFLKIPIIKFSEQILKNIKINNNNLINVIDEIIIKYKIYKYFWEIRIFGDKFVENNKDKCKIIIYGKEYKLCTNINIFKINNNILEIKLKGINKITNMSYMFYDCDSLSSLPDISKWNTQNVTNMSYMFSGCSKLSSLSDISKWNIKNVEDMKDMFKETKIKNIPDKFKSCYIF